MANIQELWATLRTMDPTNTAARKDKAFEILDLFQNLPPKERSLQNTIIAVCGAAVVLSGIVEKDLIDRVLPYLKNTDKPLPTRASQVLQANLRRMQGF